MRKLGIIVSFLFFFSACGGTSSDPAVCLQMEKDYEADLDTISRDFGKIVDSLSKQMRIRKAFAEDSGIPFSVIKGTSEYKSLDKSLKDAFTQFGEVGRTVQEKHMKLADKYCPELDDQWGQFIEKILDDIEALDSDE